MLGTGIRVHSFASTGAVLTGTRDRVYQAAMLDPHTAAVLASAQIVALVDELLAAHGAMMPEMVEGDG